MDGAESCTLFRRACDAHFALCLSRRLQLHPEAWNPQASGFKMPVLEHPAQCAVLASPANSKKLRRRF